MNQKCNGCDQLRKCVNGSYCTKAERYIEHRTDQPCAPKGRFSSLSALISHAGEQLPTEGAKGRQNENNEKITSTTKQDETYNR